MSDLTDYLFEAIERVDDDGLTPEQLDTELKRAKTVIEASRAIVEIQNTRLDAARLMNDMGVEMTKDEAKRMLALPGGGRADA